MTQSPPRLARRALLGAALSAPVLPRPALSQAARARTLRFVPQAALTVLDPLVQNATVSTTHGFCVFDTLYATDPRLRPRPQMAEGHEVSGDGRRWTIRLREGLVFHDGEAVRAADCAASLKRWCARDLFGQVLGASLDAFEAADDRTLVVRLTRPFPALLDALAKPASVPAFVLPERLAATPPERPIPEVVGSGPWRFLPGEFVSGARAAYARHEGYLPREEPADGASGGKRVHFDRLEWHAIPDGATAASALIRGEVDWVEYPLPDLLPLLARERGVRTQVYDPLGFLGVLRFNHLHPPFDRVEVRRAFRDAVRQEDHMASVAAPGDWRACRSLFPCTLEGVAEFPTPERDLAAARAAIRAAGRDGARVVVMTPTDFAAVAPHGRLGAALCRELGFEVELQEMDWAAMLTRRASREPAARGGWSLMPTNFPAASVANPAVHSGIRGQGASAWFGWPEDPGTEEAIGAWLGAAHGASRDLAFAEVQRRAWKHAGFAPLGVFVLNTGFRAELSGVLQGPNPYLWNLRRG